MESSIILSVIMLLFGSALGIVSTIIAYKIKQQHSVTDRFIEHYLEARNEIVNVLCILADLRVNAKLIDDERDKYRNKVANLYYKNLDFLPLQVLDSLLILHACLKNGKGKLYQIKNSRVIELPKTDYKRFVAKFARFHNTKLYSSIAFKYSDVDIRKNLAIKLHAQYVLFNLNKLASVNKLLSVTKSLRKENI